MATGSTPPFAHVGSVDDGRLTTGSDPSVAPGLIAPVGTVAFSSDGLAAWMKVGPLDTDWIDVTSLPTTNALVNLGGDYWLRYYSAVLAAKCQADPLRWALVDHSDFVGPSGSDYQQLLVGAGSENNALAGPGVRQFNLTAGANGVGAFSGFATRGNTTVATVAPNVKDGYVITDVRLQRWAYVYRYRLPTPSQFFTDIALGLRQPSGLFLGFGSCPALDPTKMVPIKGGASQPNVLGDQLSTKSPNLFAYIYGYAYNDLATQTIKYSIDNENDRQLCTSITAASAPGYLYGVNAPLGGVAPEALEMDKFAVWVELGA